MTQEQVHRMLEESARAKKEREMRDARRRSSLRRGSMVGGRKKKGQKQKKIGSPNKTESGKFTEKV